MYVQLINTQEEEEEADNVNSQKFCFGSLLPVFGVRVLVTFHLKCVHINFCSVSVAEWSTFGK